MAFAVAELKLAPFLPGDVEDVAIETLEELVDKVCQVERVEELKPLAASQITLCLSPPPSLLVLSVLLAKAVPPGQLFYRIAE